MKPNSTRTGDAGGGTFEVDDICKAKVLSARMPLLGLCEAVIFMRRDICPKGEGRIPTKPCLAECR